MRRLTRQAWSTLAASSRNAPTSSTGLRCQATTSAAESAGASTAASMASAAGWNPLAAIMFIPSAVCGCLAYWQYERMQWKEGLIRMREGISAAEPQDLFDLQSPTEYDKVRVVGRYLPEYSLYVGPRPRSVPGGGIQPGYLVVTPMVAVDRKGVVLVNRGWVPASWKEEAQAAAAATLKEREAKAAAPPAADQAPPTNTTAATTAATSSSSWWWGRRGSKPQQQQQQQPPAAPSAAPPPPPPPKPVLQAVVGVVAGDEQPSQFMPDNQPDAEVFHFIQREAMALTLGLPPDTPLVMALSTDPATALAMHQRSPLDERRAAAALTADDESSTANAAAAAAPTGGSSSSPYPIPKNVGDLVKFTTMPGDHRNYAAIWITLCVVLAAMGRTAVTKPWRGPRIVDNTGGNARDAWKASQAS